MKEVVVPSGNEEVEVVVVIDDEGELVLNFWPNGLEYDCTIRISDIRKAVNLLGGVL